MRQLLLLITIIIFSVASTSAARGPKGKLKGYVITKENKKVEGTVKVRNELFDQVKIRFTSKSGNTSNYKPSDIKEYGYTFNGEDQFGQESMVSIRYVAKEAEDAPMIFAKTGVFMQVEEEGAVILYNYYIQNNGDVKNPVIRQYYLERENSDEFTKLTKKNFVEIAKIFFSDNPEIAQNMGKVNHRFRHLYKVVQNYNKWIEREDVAGLPF